MDENRLRFGVGVLVVAALGVAIILTFFFGAYPNLFAGRYTITVFFPAAPGVSQETPVLKNGVQIGRVIDIKLLTGGGPEGLDGVVLTMEIEKQYPLMGDQVPRVTSGSLITGAAQIEFIRATPAQLVRIYDGQAGTQANNQLDPAEEELTKLAMTDGTHLRYGEVAKDPYEVLTMVGGLENDIRATLATIQQAGQSIDSAGRAVNQLASQVQSVIGPEDGEFRVLTQRASRAMEEFELALRDVRSVFGDPEMQTALRDSVRKFPAVLGDAQNTLKSVQSAMIKFEEVGDEAKGVVSEAKRTATNIAELTEPLAENGEQIVAKLLNSIDNFDRTVVQIGDFTEALNNSDGTLRRLLEDDELYWQVKRVMDNVEGASVRIRPILDDFRVMSDKLARDPRQLGVKGALDRRPSGIGIK